MGYRRSEMSKHMNFLKSKRAKRPLYAFGISDWDALMAAVAARRSAIASEFDALLSDSRAQEDLILGLDSEAPTLDAGALQALSR